MVPPGHEGWRVVAGANRSLGKISVSRENTGKFFASGKEHFHITTSGGFSTPALLCCIVEIGVDRILFGVDWPYIENAPATLWMQDISLSEQDRGKFRNGNARSLLRI